MLPRMRATVRTWLSLIVAGLFGLAMLAVPALHLRALPDAAAAHAAHAMPGHSAQCGEGAACHDAQRGAAHCFACVLATAPGLLPAQAGGARAMGRAIAAVVPPRRRGVHPRLARCGGARAPPIPSRA